MRPCYVWDVDGRKAACTLSAAAYAAASWPSAPTAAASPSRVGRPDEAVPDDGNRVEVWDAATRKEPLRHPTNKRAAAERHRVQPGRGRGWPSSGRGRRTRGWRSTTPARARKPPPCNVAVQAEAGSRPQPVFSAYGRRLTFPASGSLVRVWDVGTGLLRYTARGHAGTPAVAFDSPTAAPPAHGRPRRGR